MTPLLEDDGARADGTAPLPDDDAALVGVASALAAAPVNAVGDTFVTGADFGVALAASAGLRDGALAAGLRDAALAAGLLDAALAAGLLDDVLAAGLRDGVVAGLPGTTFVLPRFTVDAMVARFGMGGGFAG